MESRIRVKLGNRVKIQSKTKGEAATRIRSIQMAERLSLTNLSLPQSLSQSPTRPTLMASAAAFGGATAASARLFPSAAARATASLSSSPASSSSFKCLRSSPLVSHLFLGQVSPSLYLYMCTHIRMPVFVCLQNFGGYEFFFSVCWHFSEKIVGLRFQQKVQLGVCSEMLRFRSWAVEGCPRGYQGHPQLQVLPSYSGIYNILCTVIHLLLLFSLFVFFWLLYVLFFLWLDSIVRGRNFILISIRRTGKTKGRVTNNSVWKFFYWSNNYPTLCWVSWKLTCFIYMRNGKSSIQDKRHMALELYVIFWTTTRKQEFFISSSYQDWWCKMFNSCLSTFTHAWNIWKTFQDLLKA